MKMPFSQSSSSSFSTVRLRLLTTLLIIISQQLIPLSVVSAALLLGLRQHHRSSSYPPNKLIPDTTTEGNQTRCNLFEGSWVHDESYPIYQASECPFIDPEYNCQRNGRPDSDYLKYRWQPHSCQLPRFNGVEFLERMRGRSVMFVGDSLGRNQWVSLVCMITSALPSPSSSAHIIRAYPLTTLKFLEYDVTVSFYKAPYLVDVDIVQGKRVLKLDDISGNGNAWQGVDVLLFNTGHWWTHDGALEGWDYIESGGKMYQDMDRLSAMEQGLRTWARWVDGNVDSTTKVFFQSVSPSHYNPSDWTSGMASNAKTCYGETAPTNGISYPGDGYPAEYADQMRMLDTVLREMSVPTYLLDITMLSIMRKDCHPSIYSVNLKPGQRANPGRTVDCSHWCVPGLPDTWNQLFCTALFY